MPLLLLALGLLLVSAAASAMLRDRTVAAGRVGFLGAASACAVGLWPAAQSLLLARTESVLLPWTAAGADLRLSLDPLSAAFLVPLFLVSGLAALFGSGYLPRDRRSLHWLWFNVLVAAMAVVLLARDAAVFLIAWEAMALSSFFLVAHQRERAEVRDAAWTYLVASQLGTAFLVAFFAVVGAKAGSLDFDALAGAFSAGAFRSGAMTLGTATGLLALAFLGFGAKAGIVPLHVWLPEAHPAAPSHVSALLSGVLVKTGIYGLARTAALLSGAPAEADALFVRCGTALVLVGVASGVLGVLFALAQHDLKRLLAFHTVENIGIIVAGLGLGLLGRGLHAPALSVLGYTGAILHAANHACFKGLLFLGAGSVLRATGSREIEGQGGLLRRMPLTGAAFTVGAAAICGLPPLNGFVSELLVYVAALRGVSAPGAASGAWPSLLVLAGFPLMGGLAVACFVKVVGVVFLGEPRSNAARDAHEGGARLVAPQVVLAAACVAIGFLGAQAAPALWPAVSILPGAPAGAAPPAALAAMRDVLVPATGVFAALVAALAGWMALRWLLLSRRRVAAGVTWDCGYERPSPRMQYTASSFAQPLLSVFGGLAGTHAVSSPPGGLFPREASHATHAPPLFRERLYRPVFAFVSQQMGRARVLQHGRLHLYVLYVAAVLVGLLAWKVR